MRLHHGMVFVFRTGSTVPQRTIGRMGPDERVDCEIRPENADAVIGAQNGMELMGSGPRTPIDEPSDNEVLCFRAHPK
ncbi:MAG: hypothetical protein V1800_03075 [Candidatus Latescibacterota bacterium]